MKAAGAWQNLIRNLDRLSIERAMHYTCTAPLYGSPHRHDHKFHIAYVFVGKSRIQVQGQSHDIGPSDAIFIPARTEHASQGDDKTFYELIEIHFLITRRWVQSVPRLPAVLRVRNTAAFVPALENCVAAHLIDPNPDNWLAKIRLAEILMLIERESRWLNSAVAHPTDLHLKITQAREHIALYYNQPITVENLAEQVGLSPSHFSASFKRIVGTSPIEFVLRTRLHHARELLTGSNFSVGQVAEICGFYSPQYMARLFAQRWNLPPKKFRDQCTPKSTS